MEKNNRVIRKIQFKMAAGYKRENSIPKRVLTQIYTHVDQMTYNHSYNSLRLDDKDKKHFELVAQTEEEENEFDFQKQRDFAGNYSGMVGSVAHLVKGALGAGILAGHYAYMKAGLGTANLTTIVFGVYMAYCLFILVKCTRIIYKRTHQVELSYSDIGEAAMTLCPIPSIAKWATTFRYYIDIVICVDLFGSCACYQLIIAKSIKQLVENTIENHIEANIEGYPNLRVYIAILLIPIISICLITQLKWLTPFSVVANIVIFLTVGATVYFAFDLNPSFQHIRYYPKTWFNYIEHCSTTIFSMSCAGVVIPVSNNMKKPEKIGLALAYGTTIVVISFMVLSSFGYIAFLEDCHVPITINFPMTSIPKILKGLITVMICLTHSLNFFVPFKICWHYIKPRVNPEKQLSWELFLRATFVVAIGIVAICVPTIGSFIGFIGAFCLSNMTFIFPNVIEILTVSLRPGFGKYYCRIWKNVILILIGFVFMVIGTGVNLTSMVYTLQHQR